MKLKLLYWIPRILCILAILFVMLFSFDAFEGNESIGRKLLGFMIHNIPVVILAVILIIAWKWELTGGIIFILIAIAGSVVLKGFSTNPGILILAIPFLLVGALFILHHFESIKKRTSSDT